jgi:hypothetical protein
MLESVWIIWEIFVVANREAQISVWQSCHKVIDQGAGAAFHRIEDTSHATGCVSEEVDICFYCQLFWFFYI